MNDSQRQAIRQKSQELEAAFRDAGALLIDADALLPADILLDLYGEDIRARAYVTNDPVLGERMLRPDFTVPIVKRHMEDGAEPARYCYNGVVWRKQDPGVSKANEFTQVGFELFDRADPAKAEAEVFALFSSMLPKSLNVICGDIGLLRAAIKGLSISEERRVALLRHVWRPQRFLQLLNRFGGKSAPADSRKALIETIKNNGLDAVLKDAEPFIGQRSFDEIRTRISRLQADALEPDIPDEELALISEILGLKTSANATADAIKPLLKTMPDLQTALDRFQYRISALDAQGVDLSALQFEGGFGLTSMEYYDGFVFGFLNDDTLVASGGRYDTLTSVLGNGREIAAVGGVIRPDLLLEAEQC